MIAVSRLCALPAKSVDSPAFAHCAHRMPRRDPARRLDGGGQGDKMLGKISNLAATVDLVAMIHCDYYVPAGMHRASSAALSCVDLAGGNVPLWTIQAERHRGVRRTSRFRSFHHEPSAPAFGVRPDRKLGPEEQSHKSLTLGVCAAGNVS